MQPESQSEIKEGDAPAPLQSYSEFLAKLQIWGKVLAQAYLEWRIKGALKSAAKIKKRMTIDRSEGTLLVHR